MIAQVFNHPDTAMLSRLEPHIGAAMLKTAPPPKAPAPRNSTVVEDVVEFFRANPDGTATQLADHYMLCGNVARSRISKAVRARKIRNTAKNQGKRGFEGRYVVVT